MYFFTVATIVTFETCSGFYSSAPDKTRWSRGVCHT